MNLIIGMNNENGLNSSRRKIKQGTIYNMIKVYLTSASYLYRQRVLKGKEAMIRMSTLITASALDVSWRDHHFLYLKLQQ